MIYKSHFQRNYNNYLWYKWKNRIINHQVAFTFCKPVSDSHDHHWYNKRYNCISEIASEEHGKSGSSHDSCSISGNSFLRLPVDNFQIFFTKFFLIRCMLAHITAQIIQIIQLIKVRLWWFDMSDLRNNLAFWCLYCDLDITRNNEYIWSFKSIASAHAVKAVFQSEILCTTLKHRFSDVQDSLYNLVIIHLILPLVFFIKLPFSKF